MADGGTHETLIRERDQTLLEIDRAYRAYLLRPMPNSMAKRGIRFKPLRFLAGAILAYLALGIVGAVLTVDESTQWSSLGISLLVGALIGVASLLGAVWQAAFEWWAGYAKIAYEDDDQQLRQLHGKLTELNDKIVRRARDA